MLKKSVLTLAAIAATAAMVPSGASAATIANNGGQLTYQAGQFQTNQLKVTVDSSTVTFEENNRDQVTSAAPGCVRFDWGTRCSLSGIWHVRVYLGDMHDSLVATLNGTTPINMNGDDGYDMLDVTGNGNSRAFLNGGNGDDKLYGRQFGDTISGGYGNDLIQSGGGVDSINGGPGADNIDAGSDNDFVYAKDGTRDTVNCGSGTSDWVQYDRTWWGGSLDALTSCERRQS